MTQHPINLAVCSPRTPLLSSRQRISTTLNMMKELAQQKNQMLGYPINMTTPPDEFFAWRHELATAGFNQFAFNNVGNPYDQSHIRFNCHPFEKELIDRFGEKYGFSPENIWGFMTNSGTDSNMHGLYMGCTLLRSRTGVMPKIYFTREAHYSIQILRDLLQLEWVGVKTHDDGSMDVKDLEHQLNANSNHPALVVATIGTTFKGSIDPIDDIQRKLKDRVAYLHLDAALFGGYLPHTSFAADLLHGTCDPILGTAERYDSIAVSCHKFFGFPSPAGLFITTQKNFEYFRAQFSQVHNPEYILQVPGTITCSRDAVKPAEFYFFSSESAFAQQATDAQTMLDNAEYLLKEMNSHYSYLQPERANDRSSTIYFKKPSETIVNRYSLATMNWDIDGQPGAFAHIVVMPHAKKEILDRFLTDLSHSKENN
jgi:histidine decarboxylase